MKQLFFKITSICSLTLFFFSGCDGNKAPDYTSQYENIISSAGGFHLHPLVTMTEAPWEIYFDSTTDGTTSSYLGVLKIGHYTANIQGARRPSFSGKDIICDDKVTILMGSNTILLQTELFDDNFKSTEGLNGRSHYATLIFQGGFSDPTVNICFISLASPSDSNPAFSISLRGYSKDK